MGGPGGLSVVAREQAERGPGEVGGQGDRLVVAAEQQRRRVPGEVEPGPFAGAERVEVAVRAAGLDDEHAERREDLVAAPLVLQHVLEGGEQGLTGEAGEHQGAPRYPEGDAERGLVRAVAAHVADHDVDGAVVGAHGVVEVAAEQGAAAAGAVAPGEGEPGAVQQRGGQQVALEAGVLLAAQLGLDEATLGLVGAFAFDGVAQGAGQQRAVRFVLDQEVLGAGGDGGRAEFGPGGVGEHHDGDVRGTAEQFVQALQPVGGVGGVRQVGERGEVEQYAAELVAAGASAPGRVRGRGQQRGGLVEAAGPVDLDRGAAVGDRRLDQLGVRDVVLDDQQPQWRAAVGGAVRAGPRRDLGDVGRVGGVGRPDGLRAGVGYRGSRRRGAGAGRAGAGMTDGGAAMGARQVRGTRCPPVSRCGHRWFLPFPDCVTVDVRPQCPPGTVRRGTSRDHNVISGDFFGRPAPLWLLPRRWRCGDRTRTTARMPAPAAAARGGEGGRWW